MADGPAKIDAVVAYEGPWDYATTVYHPTGLASFESTEPDLVAAADPHSYLGGNPDLVVRLIHGDDTDVDWFEVPRAASIEFLEALEEAGYDVELILIDGASHTAITRSGNEAFDVTVSQALDPARG